jgi:hypothetical protein
MSYQGKPGTSFGKNPREVQGAYGSQLMKQNKTREESIPNNTTLNINPNQFKTNQFIETGGINPGYNTKTNHKKNLKLNNMSHNMNNMSQSYSSPNHYSSTSNTPTMKSINKKDLFSVLSPKTKKELLSLNLVKGGINNLYNNFNYTTNINNNERLIEQINLNLNMNNVNNVNVNNINHINANIHPDLGVLTTSNKRVAVGSLGAKGTNKGSNKSVNNGLNIGTNNGTNNGLNIGTNKGMNKGTSNVRKNLPNIEIDNDGDDDFDEEFNIDNEGNISDAGDEGFNVDYEEDFNVNSAGGFNVGNNGDFNVGNPGGFTGNVSSSFSPNKAFNINNSTSFKPNYTNDFDEDIEVLVDYNYKAVNTSPSPKKTFSNKAKFPNKSLIIHNTIDKNRNIAGDMKENIINLRDSNNNPYSLNKSLSGYSSPKYTKLIDSLKFQFSEITGDKEKTLKKNFTVKESKLGNNKINIKDENENEDQVVNKNNKVISGNKREISATPTASAVNSDKNRININMNMNQIAENDKNLNSYHSNKLLHSSNTNPNSSHVKSSLNSSNNLNLDNPIFKKIAHIKKSSFNIGNAYATAQGNTSAGINLSVSNIINKGKKTLNASTNNITTNTSIINTNASIVMNTTSNNNNTSGKVSIETRNEANTSTSNNEYKPAITAPAEIEREKFKSPTAPSRHLAKTTNREKEREKENSTSVSTSTKANSKTKNFSVGPGIGTNSGINSGINVGTNSGPNVGFGSPVNNVSSSGVISNTASIINVGNSFSPTASLKRGLRRDVSNNKLSDKAVGGNSNKSSKVNIGSNVNGDEGISSGKSPLVLSSVGVNTDADFDKDSAGLIASGSITSTENVPDEVFFKDKRYEELVNKLKAVSDENKFLREEDKNLKFTIEVLKSYTKVQEVRKSTYI